MNAPLPGIVVYSELGLETIDLSGVAHSTVESRAGQPDIEMKPVAVRPQIKIIGPRFKDKSGKIIRALAAMDPAWAAEQKASGSIRVDVDGESIDLQSEAVEIDMETLSAGLAVDVLRLDGASVLVRR